MDIYRLKWTRAGRDERQVSAVSYDEASTEYYEALKAAEDGASDVEVIPVNPGE
ncbi:hypothetical protein ACFQ7J_05865 [Streptomyces sp. NPDC056501]|uniref:hypothetical protein n=1 Tax=Streptomyces sp. NPDC056501 TaxID=3345841 RepID=UPI00367914FF